MVGFMGCIYSSHMNPASLMPWKFVVRCHISRPGKRVGSGRVGSWVKTGSGQNGFGSKRIRVKTDSGQNGSIKKGLFWLHKREGECGIILRIVFAPVILLSNLWFHCFRCIMDFLLTFCRS
ncbi:hypothetical protein Hanom_Chr00s001281g01678901 [Helianthus anomalus]